MGGQLDEGAGLVCVDVHVGGRLSRCEFLRPVKIVRPAHLDIRLLMARQLSWLQYPAGGRKQLTVCTNQFCRIISEETDTPVHPGHLNLSAESSFCDELVVSGALLSLAPKLELSMVGWERARGYVRIESIPAWRWRAPRCGAST